MRVSGGWIFSGLAACRAVLIDDVHVARWPVFDFRVLIVGWREIFGVISRSGRSLIDTRIARMDGSLAVGVTGRIALAIGQA